MAWSLKQQLDKFKDPILSLMAKKDKRLENLMSNIKVQTIRGVVKFTTANNVTTDVVDIVKNDLASKGCVNPNPYFLLDDLDYDGYLNGTTRKLVEDGVHDSSKALRVEGYGGMLAGTQKIPLATGMEYRAVCDVKFNKIDANGVETPADNVNEEVSYYLGVISYDSDNNTQAPYYYPYDMSKIGILTQDLNIGDTTITYSANAPIFNGSIDYTNAYINDHNYMRQVFGYKKQSNGDLSYVGSNGRVYDHHGYTRFGSYNNSGRYNNTSDEVDNGDGTYTLTLNVPWDTVALKVGDAVVRTHSGGNYNYWISSKYEKVDGKFHKYASAWTEYTSDNYQGGYGGVARNGAAYVKLLGLFNHAHHDSAGKYVAGATGYVGYYSTLRLEFREKR